VQFSIFFFLRGLPLWVVEVCGGGGLLMALCGANFHKNVPNISLYMEHAAPHPDPHPQSLFAAVACVQALLLTAGWPRSPPFSTPFHRFTLSTPPLHQMQVRRLSLIQ